MDFFRHWFSSGDFHPHGFCYLWNPTLVWLHAVSDGLIGVAYFTIPITLRSLARSRADLPFRWMFFLFGASEAHTRICAQNHELPVIFATGYSAEMSHLHEVQRLPILQKPYAPRDLARKVREALDQRHLVSHD